MRPRPAPAKPRLFGEKADFGRAGAFWYKASAPRQVLAVTAREIFSHVASMPVLNHPAHFGDGPFPAASQSVERLGCRTPGNRTSILVEIQLLWERPLLVRYYPTGEGESQL